jgi:hypothetical protein
MAGVRQHFIPQFLQRGWVSLTSSKTPKIKTYHIDKQFPQPIQNAAAERKFYEDADGLTADPEITDIESSLMSPAITQLRARKSGDIKVKDVGFLLSHFAIRTKNMRAHAVGAFDSVVESYLSDIDTFENYLPQCRQAFLDPEVLRAMLESVGKSPLEADYILRDPVRRETYREALFGHVTKDTFAGMAKLLSMLKSESLVHTASLKAYKATQSRKNNWTEAFRGMSFTLIDLPKPLMLGDSCTIFRDKRTGWSPMVSAEQLLNACLPIGRYRLIWGYRHTQHRLPDWQTINEALADCSCEFFLSNLEDDFTHLQPRIGLKFSQYVHDTSKEMAGQLIETMTNPIALSELIRNRKNSKTPPRAK